jgi:hypothetical protein
LLSRRGTEQHTGSNSEQIKRAEFAATLPPGLFDVFVAAGGFAPYCQKVRTPQEIRAVLKLDPDEYGDNFGGKPLQVGLQK